MRRKLSYFSFYYTYVMHVPTVCVCISASIQGSSYDVCKENCSARTWSTVKILYGCSLFIVLMSATTLNGNFSPHTEDVNTEKRYLIFSQSFRLTIYFIQFLSLVSSSIYRCNAKHFAKASLKSQKSRFNRP